MRPHREAALHPLSVTAFAAAAVLAAILFTNPVYLLGLLAVTALAAVRAGAGRRLVRSLAFMLPVMAVIVIFNCIFCGEGETVLLRLPWAGGRAVTLESLLFGLTMSAKLILIVSVFCLYDAMQDMDAAFSFFSKVAFRSLFIVIVTTLMIPRMRRDLDRIGAAMRKRGAPLSSGPLLSRIRASYPLVKVLLLSSLEGSLAAAESMHCRAFGAGPRSVYRRPGLKRVDRLVIGASLFSLAGVAAALAVSRGSLDFYPAVGGVFDARDALLMAWILSGLIGVSLSFQAEEKWKSILSAT